ncbi:PDDEXK-like family protein [Geomonas ferrireducens]|uniref:PDDEXK-like family protein n=1 Tax=Geomonas ferrireducens TaxID=2570227 RepID=UPI0010A7CBA5|nr:PD-(D/E)XK nuclease family protein [Geomonas ferrireducens]
MDSKCADIITDQIFEELELSLREPNIFRALSIERKELRHSNFIAYILDPRENHGLKDIVLRKLLRDVFSESKYPDRTIFDADYLDLNNIEIRREWRNIDILIILKDDVIIVENKVDTVDHSNQLRRYRKIADESFATKKRHYVYLTPFGTDPQDTESRSYYINYSYVQIADIIGSILKLYSNSISQKIGFYLSDYLTTIKRELLMNDTLNELALKVYNAHKEAFDFIFENRPDPASLLYRFFEEEVTAAGFAIGSRNKGYVRFTTKELEELLPKGGEGWPNKEVFLFEIEYYWTDKTADFNAVISPCDEAIRDAIHEAAKKSDYYKAPAGKKWLVLHKRKYPFVASEMINEDDDDIRKKIRHMIQDIRPVALDMSQVICERLKEVDNTIDYLGSAGASASA